MTKLSQFGNWNPDLEAKAREIMLLRYSESSDDVLDFKICQRGDGSTYGIGKAKKCVQGVEVSRADIVRQLQEAGVDQRTIARLNTSAKSDEEFAKEAQDLRPKTTPEKQPTKPVQKAIEPTEKAKAGQASAGAGTVHELALARELAGGFDKISGGKGAEELYNKNKEISKASGETAERIAVQNAKDLRAELEKSGMKQIDEVVWTAQLRGDGLSKAAGVPGLSEKNNQADILIKGRDENGNEMVYGVSLKVATSSSTKYPNDIPFFNGGLGKEAGRLGVEQVSTAAAEDTKNAIKALGIQSRTAAAAKSEIRNTPGMKARADEAGKRVLANARDGLIAGLSGKSPEEIRTFLSTMTGAPTGDGRNLPTLKLTGYSTGSKTTKIEDAIEGRVAKAVATATNFTYEPAGSTGVRILADGVPVMKIRTKWESQALGSSIKISGESP